ncbi:MAG: SDR family NAD(P)-dependent oxidoreductase [Hyphomicrobiaceae bacterium]
MTDAQPLKGATCLIAGGTAGIGLACAKAFLRDGVRAVCIVGRDPDRAEQARAALATQFSDAETFCLTGDVTDPVSAERVADAAAQSLGRVDCLVNSTGGDDMPALFHKQDIAMLPGLVQRGLMGHIMMSRAVLPTMMEQNSGTILNVASDAAKIATPGESVIGAIMAGIVMFTRGLAIEAKRNGIRVNCITPSIVRGTPLYDRLMADEFSGKLFAKAEKMAHLGVAEAEDLAELAVFLASPAAARITGQAISVNGGISAA